MIIGVSCNLHIFLNQTTVSSSAKSNNSIRQVSFTNEYVIYPLLSLCTLFRLVITLSSSTHT